MAAPWFRVESSMITHPKIYKLAELLDLKPFKGVKPSVIAAGLVLGVWSWATQNATDGDLSHVAPAAVAEAAGWTKKPQQLFDALIEAGFIDKDGDEVWLHDWIDYASLLAEQEAKRKENDRKRSKEYRDRKKTASSQQNHAPNNCERHSDGDVTNTVTSQQNHAPYITRHNDTVHNNPLNIDRKDIIDSTSIPDSNVTADDSFELPGWVNDPDYVPTIAEIEALPTFELRSKFLQRRVKVMYGSNKR